MDIFVLLLVPVFIAYTFVIYTLSFTAVLSIHVCTIVYVVTITIWWFFPVQNINLFSFTLHWVMFLGQQVTHIYYLDRQYLYLLIIYFFWDIFNDTITLFLIRCIHCTILTCFHQIIHVVTDSTKYNLINLIKVFNLCTLISESNNVPFFKEPNTGQYVQSKTGW